MRNQSSNLAKVAVLTGLLTLNAGAMQINLGLDVEFSGAVAPVSTNTPWMCAEFLTVGNDVEFTLTAPNLTDPEGAKAFYFNFDDNLDVTALSFALQSSSGSFTLPTIQQSMNAFKADGDGFYDVRLNFATGGNTSDTFGLGDEISFLISYSSAITENDFGYESAPGGGTGTYYAAAHVQNTSGIGDGAGQSGWIGAAVIPEPTSFSLLFLGLAGLGLTSFRTRNDHSTNKSS